MFSMPNRRSSWALRFLILFEHFALVEGPLDRHLQFFVDQRLGEEIERAGANRFDGRFDGAVAGEQDHGRVRMMLAAMGQDVEAVAVGQADVGQHEVVRLAIDGRHCRGPIGGDVDPIALLAQPIGHRFQHVPIVVDQQQQRLLHCELYRGGQRVRRPHVTASERQANAR